MFRQTNYSFRKLFYVGVGYEAHNLSCMSWALFSIVTFSKWHTSQKLISEFTKILGVGVLLLLFFLPSFDDGVTKRTVWPWFLTLKLLSQILLWEGDKQSSRKCKPTAEKEPEPTFFQFPITSFNRVKFRKQVPRPSSDSQNPVCQTEKLCSWWSVVNDGVLPLIYKQNLH